jgi:hypothetical protein
LFKPNSVARCLSYYIPRLLELLKLHKLSDSVTFRNYFAAFGSSSESGLNIFLHYFSSSLFTALLPQTASVAADCYTIRAIKNKKAL